MRTDRPEAHKQIVSDPSAHVMIACEALEAVGFRIMGDLRALGKHILIECRLPLALGDVITPDNPNYVVISVES